MMQAVGRRYVRYFNERHGRTGTLWEGRYKSTLIQTERYLLACMAYIDLNPVRAGMVAEPRRAIRGRAMRTMSGLRARQADDAASALLGRWATRRSHARPPMPNWCDAGVPAADSRRC